MIKITEITKEQLESIKQSENPINEFKNIIKLDGNYQFGDTSIEVDNAKPLDIFKYSFKGRDFYYIIVELLSDKMAFAYSIYPIN